MASTDTQERAREAAAAAVAGAGKAGKTGAKTPETPKIAEAEKTEAGSPVSLQRVEGAPEGTCGFPVTVKSGIKACLKEAGHEGDHSSRKYNKISLDGLSADALAPEAFGADEELTQLSEEAERGELQSKVDQQVSAAHAEWVKAGKPATFPAAIRAGVAKRYFIEPAQAEAYRTLLRSAGRFHHVRIKIAPVQKHTSGRTMLPWIAMDQREKPGTAKTS